MGARIRTCGVALLLTVGSSAVGVGPAAASSGAGGREATFEGRPIVLSEGWGPARACVVEARATTCFRSEAAMDRFLGGPAGASCSTALRLYDGTSYSSQSLALTTRGVYVNLVDYGFAARTSSYRIGACSAYLNDGDHGGGVGYPGTTTAYAQSASMVTGWNNRIRSVYIY